MPLHPVNSGSTGCAVFNDLRNIVRTCAEVLVHQHAVEKRHATGPQSLPLAASPIANDLPRQSIRERP